MSHIRKIRLVIRYLTPFNAKDNPIDFTSPAGQQKLDRFMKLYLALHEEKPRAIWAAYEAIRGESQELEYLSTEVWRLLVVYFKDAIAPASATLANDPKSRQANTVSTRRSVEQRWAARVVTVLDDKRSIDQYISRWDSSDLMSALNRLERYEESLQELDRVLASKVKIDPILLNHAVRAWGGLGQLDRAMKTIRDLTSRFDLKPSQYTLGYLIQQYILQHQVPVAKSLWRELAQDGTLEEIGTVNGILRACVTIQESHFAQEVYDSMPGLGIEANIESLNLMLSLAVAEITYLEEREQFLEAMNDKISRSDRAIYNKSMLDSILVNFSKKGDAEGAILVHRLMSRHGFQPGTLEYNEILHCYTRQQNMEKAVAWFYQMRTMGIRPDRLSYLLLMRSYTRQRMPRETEALFRQLIQDGIGPDLALCNTLLLSYEQARMNRRALQLYKIMFQDHTIGLDNFSFSCMFNAVFHNDKAVLEGGEGRGGRGASLDSSDYGFLRKISVPIGQLNDFSEQHSITLENESSLIIETRETPLAPPPPLDSLYPPRLPQPFQFEGALSTTAESLDARSLFRDMIIVGVRPTPSLYSNILRAFLSQHDHIGAAVALRTLVDYYALKVTPKMSAIVVTLVLQELERRGSEIKNDRNELLRLTNQIRRTRGLVEILESLSTTDPHTDVEGASSPTVHTDATTASSTFTNTETTIKSTPRSLKGSLKDTLKLDQFQVAKMEMGGDLVDLFSKSPLAGSAWTSSPSGDDSLHIDLQDFERWYQAYGNRTTRAQMAKARSHHNAASAEPLESAEPTI
jgi:pentatricopeptide repeat protein